jgi:hypothetical protein
VLLYQSANDRLIVKILDSDYKTEKEYKDKNTYRGVYESIKSLN